MDPTANRFSALSSESELALSTVTSARLSTATKKEKVSVLKPRAVDNRRRLFIGNLTAEPDAWQRTLKTAASCGWIEAAEMLYDVKYSSVPFGIIWMRTHQDAERLMKLIGTKRTKTVCDSHGVNVTQKIVYAEWARRQ